MFENMLDVWAAMPFISLLKLEKKSLPAALPMSGATRDVLCCSIGGGPCCWGCCCGTIPWWSGRHCITLATN